MKPTDDDIITAPRPGRLTSLDVFRGATVAGMILVNNPGSDERYSPLDHAKWHGWTPTDLVFPFFLFIVGVSITFAFSRRLEDPDARSGIYWKILRRTLIIFGLGIAIAGFPRYNNWATIRIPGVLQRIAICYGVASLVFLWTKARGQAILAAALLVGYWALERYVPVPGIDTLGNLDQGKDLSSYLDRLLLSGHIYKKDYDPEGILSTLPSIATTLLGVLTGHWLRSGRGGFELVCGLFVAGTVAIVAGEFWGLSFPINKALWTSSFVLLTGGLAMVGLATCYWLVEIHGYRRWSYPFRAFGANPIAAYTLAAIGARVMNMPLVKGENGPITAHQWMNLICFDPYLSPLNASLAFAMTFVLACFLVVAVLDLFGLRIRA